MTQIKKFGLGAFAAALFAVMAMATLVNTASADADALDAADSTISALGSTTLTVTLDAAPADGDTIRFDILTTSTATGGLGDNLEQVVFCTISDDVSVGDGTDDSVTDCDDGTATYDVADGSATPQYTITLESAGDEGDLDTRARHDGVSATETVTVAEGAGAAATITLSAAASVAAEGRTAVTATVLDEDGNEVEGANLDVFASGDIRLVEDNATAGTCENNIADGTALVTTCNAVAADADGETTVIVEALDETGGTGTITFQIDGQPVFASANIAVAGAVDEIAITVPAAVAVGSTTTITVLVSDAEGDAVADDTEVTVQASAGFVLNCNPGETANGLVECDYIAPNSAQTVTIVATANGQSATGTIEVSATGTPTDPTDPGTDPGTGDGSFASAPNFGTGNVGSAVFNGGTIAELSAAVTASGGTAVWVQGTDGNWYRYNTLATGATAFVNNAFEAQFAAGFGTTAVFVVR